MTTTSLRVDMTSISPTSAVRGSKYEWLATDDGGSPSRLRIWIPLG